MFHQSFSCRGDPGIGFDYEYGIRLWKRGFEVGLTIMHFRYHQGSSRSSGTRSSTGAKVGGLGQPSLISRSSQPAHSNLGDFGRVGSVFGSFCPYDAVYFGLWVTREFRVYVRRYFAHTIQIDLPIPLARPPIAIQPKMLAGSRD